MRRRTSVVSLIVLVAVLAAGVVLSGCRTAAPPEAGLPAEVFARDSATITRGPQGGWHAVAAADQKLAGFVTVTFDGNGELFYAVPLGDRASAILPITPTSRAWLNSAEKNPVELSFADDPARLEFSDPVGLWNGADGGEITWLGRTPESAALAAALPAAAPESDDVALGEHISGVVELSENTASTFDGELGDSEAGYLLLPERGSQPDEVRVVDTTGEGMPELGEQFDVVQESLADAFARNPTEYEYLPAGRQLGADILVFNANNETYVAAIGPSKFTLVDGTLTPVSVARVALRVTEPAAVESAVRGLAYVKWRAPLAATYAFSPENYQVYENPRADDFRIAELAGAAGLAEWARIPLFRDAEGVTPGRLFYFANAVALSPIADDLSVAESFYREASSGFAYWASEPRKIGQARARTGLAMVLVRREQTEEAIEMLEMALDRYKETSQPVYVADIESLMADVFYIGGQTEQALEKAKVARSRYYHSNARYHAALAESKMAALLLSNGDAEEAKKIAGYARQRLEGMGEPVATNRAAVVEVLAEAELGGSDGLSTRLAQSFERAVNLNDAEGAAMAASAIALTSAVRDSERLARLGSLLVLESGEIIDPVARERADRAVGVFCAQGLSRVAGENPRVEQVCSDVMADVAGDPATLRSWLEQGYKHLQKGDADLANKTLQDLEAELDDDLTSTEPILSGRILVFKWAVGQIDDASDDATIERAMTLFESGLNPETAADRLAEMAETQRARGLTEVAVWTLSLAAQQARDAKNYDRERALTLELLETHRTLSKWSALRGAARDAKNVMARGGEAANPQLAHVELYLAHAYYNLDKTADGDLTTESAIEHIADASASEKLSFYTLAADFARERADLELATNRITEIQRLLAKGAGAKGEAARANLVRGDVYLAQANTTAAVDAYAAALGFVRTAALSEGGVERVAALTQLAGLSESLTAIDDYENQISAALDTANGDREPLAMSRAYQAAVEYHLNESDAGRAERLLKKVHELGLSIESRFATDCLDGRVLLANGKSEDGIPRLERCVERMSPSPAGELARVQLALANADMAAQNKAAVAKKTLESSSGQLPIYERRRLEWMVEYAEPSKTFDANIAERLKERAEKTSAPDDLAAYADYLIACGRTETASNFIDNNSTSFFSEGEESPGALIRLRLETTVRELEPGAADFYARRSLSEATGVDDAPMARIQLLLAQNSLIAGTWWSARRQLQEARELAESSGDRDLQKRVAEFGETFSVLSNAE